MVALGHFFVFLKPKLVCKHWIAAVSLFWCYCSMTIPVTLKMARVAAMVSPA